MSEKQQSPDRKGQDSPTPKPVRKRPPALIVIVVALIVIGLAAGGVWLAQRGSLGPGVQESSQAETASNSGNNEATNEDNDATQASDVASDHEHDWTLTYRTVHHDAVTHTETVDPVYEDQTTYHTVCNECGDIIDGQAAQHIRDTGHSGYSTNVPITNEVLVSEGYTHEVTDTPAYDEMVADSLVCTICGETQSISAEATE